MVVCESCESYAATRGKPAPHAVRVVYRGAVVPCARTVAEFVPVLVDALIDAGWKPDPAWCLPSKDGLGAVLTDAGTVAPKKLPDGWKVDGDEFSHKPGDPLAVYVVPFPAGFPDVTPRSTGPLVEAVQVFAGQEPTGYYDPADTGFVEELNESLGLDPVDVFSAETARRLEAALTFVPTRKAKK